MAGRGRGLGKEEGGTAGRYQRRCGSPSLPFPEYQRALVTSLWVLASRAHGFGQAAGARERDVLPLARWQPEAAVGAAGGCWRQHATAGGQRGASLASAAERRHGPVVRGQRPRPAGPERHAARGAAR